MSFHSGNARPEVLRFLPPNANTVLDVGCSDGLFGQSILDSRPGATVEGVEPDRGTAASATRRLSEVHEGFFPQAVPRGRVYDCITFLDVLEHLENPREALEAASTMLAPGGAVVASLPNIRHIGALRTILMDRDWPQDDQGTFDRTHLRFFTESTMRRLFEDSGYRVDTCSGINESRRLLARVLSVPMGRDIRALQFAIVARPATGATS